MGFFDRFSKTFRGKKTADDEVTPSAQPSSYSTLSIFSPELTSSKTSAPEFMSSGNGAVAVDEMPDFTSPVITESENNGASAPADYFDTDFEQDLDAVFASLEKQSTAPAVTAEASEEDVNSHDQQIVEQLFADIAANYARPIKNFMFELKRGTATKEWVEICRPAMQGITRAAEGMGLRQAAQRMMDFEAALSLAQQNEQVLLVRVRARLGARTEQEQQWRLSGGVRRVHIGAVLQQQLDDPLRACRLGATESELRDGVQRLRAALVLRLGLRAMVEQQSHDFREAERRRNHQRCSSGGQALVDRQSALEKRRDDGVAARGHGCTQWSSAARRLLFRIGAEFKQAACQRRMPAAAGAQQRGRTLGVDGVNRQAQADQFFDRLGVADGCGRRQIFFAHPAPRKFPLRPVQQLARFRLRSRQRQSERTFAAGRR